MDKPDNPLAAKLFKLVEAPAGYAHISDGIGNLSTAEILEVAKKARDNHARCVVLLDGFLKKHKK